MPTLAIQSNRRQEIVSMPNYSLELQNWAISFGIQFMRTQVLAF